MRAGSPAGAGPAERTMLAGRMSDECAGAVDSLEIAAALEADGVSDETAATAYGCPDVFDLAERLYAMTPRRPRPPAAPPDRWRAAPARHLLRGLAFGMPGLCYAAAAPAAARPGAAQRAEVAVLLLSLLVSWGGGQALSYLAYVRLGRGDHRAAARVLRRGAGGGAAVTVSLTVGAAAILHAGRAAMALGAAQSLYLLAATASLMPVPRAADARHAGGRAPGGACRTGDRGGECLLLCALAPGAIASGADLLEGSGPPVPGYVWIGCGLTIAAVVALAAWRTSLLSRVGAPAARPQAASSTVALREVRDALPYAAFGVLAGLLLTFAAVATIAGRGGPGPVTVGDAAGTIAPLSLSMGPAEWLLLRYRRHAYLLLHQAPTIAAFASRARRALAVSVAGYLATLIALTTAFGWLITSAAARPSHDGALVPHAACAALGGALYVGLVMQSCGRSAAPLTLGGLALAAETAVTWAGSPAWDAAALPAIQLSCYAALLAALLAVALAAVSKVARHA